MRFAIAANVTPGAVSNWVAGWKPVAGLVVAMGAAAIAAVGSSPMVRFAAWKQVNARAMLALVAPALGCHFAFRRGG